MMEQEKVGKNEDHDGSISACSDEKVTTAAASGKMEEEEEKEADEEEGSGDELLTFPSSGILSPLSKSVEAVVTPLVRPRHFVPLLRQLTVCVVDTECFWLTSCVRVCVWSSQRLTLDQDTSPATVPLGQGETSTPPAEAAPLYR